MVYNGDNAIKMDDLEVSLISGNLLVYTYIYLGKLQWPYCDLTGIMASKGNRHPMTTSFGLVNCYTSPRYIDMEWDAIWLVVWNMAFICLFSWEFYHPNWLSYFSGGLKPQTSSIIIIPHKLLFSLTLFKQSILAAYLCP